MLEPVETLNEQYAARVIAAMTWNATDHDGFGPEVADDVADEVLDEVDATPESNMHGEIAVRATVSGVGNLKNSRALESLNFTVLEYRDATLNDDGSMTVQFAGFRTPDDLSISLNEWELIEAEDATKYSFVVTVEP